MITYIMLCGYPPFYGDNNKEIFKKITTSGGLGKSGAAAAAIDEEMSVCSECEACEACKQMK